MKHGREPGVVPRVDRDSSVVRERLSECETHCPRVHPVRRGLRRDRGRIVGRPNGPAHTFGSFGNGLDPIGECLAGRARVAEETDRRVAMAVESPPIDIQLDDIRVGEEVAVPRRFPREPGTDREQGVDVPNQIVGRRRHERPHDAGVG